MVGWLGLWKILNSALPLFCDLSSRLPFSAFHPPLYRFWSSQRVGYPVPGLVSTLFHHMYSVPRRSVQMFLQAIEQVWQPMHLSRWNTIETCERTFILFVRCLIVSGSPLELPFQFRKLAHEHVGVAVAARRPPIVEVKGELPITAGHQVRLQARPGQAV